MRSPRSVTLQPMGMPSRILKPAIEFLARVITGRCPAIDRQLLDRVVERLRVELGLADAHVERDLLEPRDRHDGVEPELLLQLVAHLARRSAP